MTENTNQEVTQENPEIAANQGPTQETAFDTKDDKGFSFESVIYGEGEAKRGTPMDTPPQQAVAPNTTAPEQGQPEVPDAKNDEKRFEYWQSRASKLENQLKEQQPVVDYIKENPQAIQQPAQAEAADEFPLPQINQQNHMTIIES